MSAVSWDSRVGVRIEFERLNGVSATRSPQTSRYIAQLSPQEEACVRSLLPKAFYAYRSSVTLANAPAAYDLVVDDGVARHQLLLAEPDVPESLRPLLHWLEERAAGSGFGNEQLRSSAD